MVLAFSGLGLISVNGENLPVEIAAASRGEMIYFDQCASCHGDEGEGVDVEYDEPLWGEKSLASLTRYIHKSMPEEDEDAVIDDDAADVAEYIYDAFYSPAAHARNRVPRVELLRLANNQYRQSVADLVGSFNWQTRLSPERGLKARYFNSEKMAKEKDLILERVDAAIDFDFGSEAPAVEMTQEAFSIHWSGALIAPDSGVYDFRLRTHNGAQVFLNGFEDEGSETAFIDAYVSTGNTLQEKTGRAHLLGGRAYPISLEYFSYEEAQASIHLDWKPPHGVWEPIPTEFLMPHPAAPVTVVETVFSADDRSLGYERGSAVTKEWQESTSLAAISVTNHIITNLGTITRLRKEELKDPSQLLQFALDFAERAFRRPLEADGASTFIGAQFDTQSDPEIALRHSLLFILTSPRFLYPGLADGDGAPDDYAIASRLALTLWDSLPDAALRLAARLGKLSEPEEVAAQARRMLADPRTRQKARAFFRNWLAMDEREDLGKDPELFPGFDRRMVADLRVSLDRFVDEVMWSESSDYRELLLADYLYLNPRLASFYQAPDPAAARFEKIAFPSGQRFGILTHPFLLSANAYHDNTSPIHRGVFLSKNVLGRLLKPPPEAVAFQNETFDPSLSMREKVTELTKKETCMRCHAVINPVGFTLESFDAVGNFRTEDNRKPINTVSDYVNDRDERVRVSSAKDLAELAIGSAAAHRAFITHLFHHLTKQSTAAYGADVLDSLREEFVDSDFNIQKLITEIATLSAMNAVPGEASPGDLLASTPSL